MTLPFRNQQPHKYRCFVCGVDFTDYSEFREHVTANHEEGREYVLCKCCNAPVRDLRLHYKTKHPNKPLPKEGQMRALIWYDFTGNKRKRDKSKPNFKEGYHPSPKNNFMPIHYRSGYEHEVYLLLDEYNEVVSYEAEPKDCVTPYFWDGEMRNYWPDLKVMFADGHCEIWEIKPSNQTDYEQNQVKWHSCAEAMGRRGFRFSVKTEQGINRLRRKVLDQKKSQQG